MRRVRARDVTVYGISINKNLDLKQSRKCLVNPFFEVIKAKVADESRTGNFESEKTLLSVSIVIQLCYIVLCLFFN